MSVLFILILHFDRIPNKCLKELKLTVFNSEGLFFTLTATSKQFYMKVRIHRELQEAVHIDRGEVTIYQRAPGLPQEVVERVRRRGQSGSPLARFLQGRLMLPLEMSQS